MHHTNILSRATPNWVALFIMAASAFSLVACSDDEKNLAPDVNAGKDQLVKQNTRVKLIGEASVNSSHVDKAKLTYKWVFKSKPLHSTAKLIYSDQHTSGFIADMPGQYDLEFMATNGTFESAPDIMTINVIAIKGAPISHAGTDITGSICSSIRLNGDASRAGSKKSSNKLIAYDWKFISRPEASTALIVNNNKVSPSFTPDKEGVYKIGLVVTIDNLRSKMDAVKISVDANTRGAIARQGSCVDVHAYKVVRGQLRPSQYSLMSAGISAKLKRFPLLRGHYVRKGQKIVEFDCRVERTEKKSSDHKLRVAKQKFDVNKRLFKLNNISKLELDVSKAEYGIALEDQKRTRAVQSECIIRAPFSGIITEKHVQAFQHVTKGDPLFKLVNTSSLEVEMLISSRLLKEFGTNAKFSITLDETGKSVDAKIDRIVGVIDPVSQTVRVIGKLINPPGNLLPGMSGPVNFQN